MQIVNPATEEVIKELNEDTPEILQEKFRQLSVAQQNWYRVPLEERIQVLLTFSRFK